MVTRFVSVDLAVTVVAQRRQVGQCVQTAKCLGDYVVDLCCRCSAVTTLISVVFQAFISVLT